KIVDLVYGGRIEAAQKAIDAAVAEFKAAKKGKAQEDWLEAVDLHSKSTHELLAATQELKQALVGRRLAYFQVAGVAGSAGGGSQDEQHRVSALVGAIPVCETVVTLTDDILEHWRGHQLTWSVEVGLAMNMLKHHNFEVLEQWETCV